LWNNGCAVRVLKMLKFPDNTVRVLVEGLRRFRIAQYESHEPYLRAKIEVIRDSVEQSLEMTAMTRNAQRQFQEIINLSPAMSDEVKVAALNTEHPGKLADLIAANLNLSLEEREQLLEMNVVRERLTRLLPLLSRELEVLTLGSKIQKEVASSMSKSQRDFFLREQIRAIQRELGESDPATSEINSLRDQIEKNQLPDDAKKVGLKELERLQQIPPTTPEYTVSRNYLDWIVNLPWAKGTEDKIDLAAAERILDEQHYGLTRVKDRLLEFLAVIKLKNKLKGPILCLVGPPGGNLPASRWAACVMKRRFGVIDEPMSAHCRDALFRACGAWRAITRSFCWTRSTRLARIFAAIRRRPCWKCSIPNKTTRSRTITSTCRSTCRMSCSSPRPTGWIRFTPRCATGWK
jgi:ATP-dependent Lon protease